MCDHTSYHTLKGRSCEVSSELFYYSWPSLDYGASEENEAEHFCLNSKIRLVSHTRQYNGVWSFVNCSLYCSELATLTFLQRYLQQCNMDMISWVLKKLDKQKLVDGKCNLTTQILKMRFDFLIHSAEILTDLNC